MLDASMLDHWLEPCATRCDSWGSDVTQEIEFNKININCRVHGESERSFDTAPTAFARAVRACWIFKCTHRLKSCLWVRRCAASGFCCETCGAVEGYRARDDRWSWRATAFNRRDIVRPISGGRSDLARHGKTEDEKRASDARLINNVGAIFIWQEEGSSLQR